MNEPSLDQKQKVIKLFLYEIRKDNKIEVEENKLFKSVYSFINLPRDVIKKIDSDLKAEFKNQSHEGDFNSITFFKSLISEVKNLIDEYKDWFIKLAEIISNKEELLSLIPEIQKNKSSLNEKTNFCEQGRLKLKDEDLKGAIETFQAGIDKGEDGALLEMAKLIEDFASPNYSPDLAFKLFGDLSEKGCGEATRHLAVMTMEGRGVGINSPKSVSIYKRAIKQGDTDSIKLLEEILMTLTPEEIEKSKTFK